MTKALLWKAKRQGNPLTPSSFVGHEFRTKKACKAWIDENYGYVRTRRDLRAAPHHWRVPKAVRVTVTVTEDWEWTPTRFDRTPSKTAASGIGATRTST